MEATTPPNTTGFIRKPTRKNRRTGRSRFTSYRKPHGAVKEGMLSEATAWLYGSMFLMAAAKILAPFMGLSATAVQPATSSAE